MTDGGFFERKTASPTGLIIVVILHAAALGAVALIKGPEIVRPFFPRTKIEFIPLPKDPPPDRPPPPDPRLPQQPSVLDRVEPIVQRPTDGYVSAEPLAAPLPPISGTGPELFPPTRADLPPQPVRIAARFDPRFASELQPPYPPSEQRAQRDGLVRVRVTIGADGQVKAAERLSATSDAFWRATERHAMARWRFRAATLDGRPVESHKTMNVFFRIQA